MRNILNFIFLFLLIGRGISQINLVPNPSFEDTFSCPFFLGDLSPISNWSNFGNTPDIFHTCSSGSINIPNSDFGYQNAHSGNAMAGIICYVWELDPGWPNYREYIGVQLSSPLEIGEKYYISFFINCAGYIPGWQHIGANKIGARFSTFEYDVNQPTLPDNFSHIYTDSIVTDTTDWYKVTGSFIADSAYQYLIIGNFFDHIQTNTIIFGGEPFGGSSAYYYIDDVCVTSDSLFNENWQGTVSTIENQTNLGIICFPNPVNKLLNIKSDLNITSLELINYLGQTILYMDNINEHLLNVPVNQYEIGHYFLKVNSLNQSQFIKVVIN